MIDTEMDTLEVVLAEFRRVQEGWKQTLAPHVYRAVLIEVAEQCEDRLDEVDDPDGTDDGPTMSA